MAELTTLARPYAKAVFDAAQDQNAVDQWDQALAFAAQVAADQEVKNILANPGLSEQRKAELFAECFEEPLPEALRNFLLILAENKRLEKEIARLEAEKARAAASDDELNTKLRRWYNDVTNY